jgi:hypothetical protein
MRPVPLPVAETRVLLQTPAGAEDLLLLESGPPDLRVALALLERVVQTTDGLPVDVAALALTDVDALLLELRRLVIGDKVLTDATCAAPTCRARVDISFSIGEYLAHHAPSAPPGLVPIGDGWHRLDGGIELRAPRAADQLAIAWEADPERALLERCVRPTPASSRAEIEAALEAIAPSLCGELDGLCPECGATVEVEFDPLQYTLRELRDRARWLYEDVAWIAHHYHWSEAEILALPAARRARYAELAADHARHARTR